MKKIAICIPSFNESVNIKNITKKVDDGLTLLDNSYESVIINCDNCSLDNTNTLFNEVKTRHKKISISSELPGKGRNIINFLEYMSKENFDYGITIDADLKSFDGNWLVRMVNELEKGADFVTPLYYRRKEEGNTTNHFIVPILYATYGKFIRQPIGGDYAFDLQYVKEVLKQNFTENILKYGIDIFLVINAIVGNFKINEVYLGEKIHSVSYFKMTSIFEGVLNGFIESYEMLPPTRKELEKIDYQIFARNEKAWEYKDSFKSVYHDIISNYAYQELNYEEIKEKWFNSLANLVIKLPNITLDEVAELEKLFLLRVISFWDEVNINDNNLWEQEIIESCNKIGEMVFNGIENNE